MCADNWIHAPRQRRVTVELNEGTTYEGVRLARCDCGDRVLVRLTQRLTGRPGGPGYRLHQDVAFPAGLVAIGSTTD